MDEDLPGARWRLHRVSMKVLARRRERFIDINRANQIR